MRLTIQEFIDAVKKRAVDNPVRCADEDGRCLYRDEGGNKCFIGDFISDESYSPEMEGDDVQVIINMYPRASDKLLNIPFGLLNRVQAIHDENEPEDWLSELNNIDLSEYVSDLE